MPQITETNPGANGDTQTLGDQFTSLTINYESQGESASNATCRVKLKDDRGDFTVGMVTTVVNTINKTACGTPYIEQDIETFAIRLTDNVSGEEHELTWNGNFKRHYFEVDILVLDPITSLPSCQFSQSEIFIPSAEVTATINHTAQNVLEFTVGGSSQVIILATPGSVLGDQFFTPLSDPYDVDRIFITYDEGFVETEKEVEEEECPYPDGKWTFNANAEEDISNSVKGGFFKVSGSHFKTLNVWLCSNDGLGVPSFVVLLRNRDGRFWLTRCSRINYAKIPKKCTDRVHRVLRWLKGGRQKGARVLDPVSVGFVVSSTTTTAVVKSQIGQVSIKNDFGAIIDEGVEVVIYNPNRHNDFAKVLGPSGPLS